MVESFLRASAFIYLAMKQIYEFEDFRADPSEQILLHEGKPVALTPKVFETLLVLLESEGRLIDKNDFVSRLWPGIFVEDAALAKNVSHLRKILADGKNGIEMIQTVPKRGYRFAVPVRKLVDAPAQGSAAHHSLQIETSAERENRSFAPAVRQAQIEMAPSTAESGAGSKASTNWIFPLVILLLAALGAREVLTFFHRSRALTETDTVVLADFVNSTGDPGFDGPLRQGVAVKLEQSPFLSLVSERRIQQTLRMIGRPADARLNLETALEICARTGSAAVIEGSIASIGSQYVLGLRAENCRSGDVLDEEQGQAARKEDVLRALDKTAIRLRNKLGQSLSLVQKSDRRPERGSQAWVTQRQGSGAELRQSPQFTPKE